MNKAYNDSAYCPFSKGKGVRTSCIFMNSFTRKEGGISRKKEVELEKGGGNKIFPGWSGGESLFHKGWKHFDNWS